MKDKGKRVTIKDRRSQFYGHWGYINNFDGQFYHVSGGSISTSFGEINPIFDRDQIRIHRTKKK